MTQKKFIQLLNLYIDGEATPIEAREVEKAIESDPGRRRIYHDYCRIQAATRAMYSQFRLDGTDSVQAGTSSTGRMRAAGVRSAVAQPGHVPGRPFRRALFWASGAAAACLALLAAFWSMPRLSRPQSSINVAETDGVSVPTTPVAIAVAEADASNPAPFASEVRIDPYLIGSANPAGDPFSLTPSSRPAGFGESGIVLGSVPNFQPAGFSPGYGRIDTDRVAEENRKLKAILSREIVPEGQSQSKQQGPFVPVNYRQQP